MVKPIKTNCRNIPSFLSGKRFVCFEIKWDGEKYKKIPYTPGTDNKASSTDPSTWRSKEEAMADIESGRYAYIGYAFHEGDRLIFIDLDATDDPDELEDHERALSLFNSYTEYSISGEGKHIIGRGVLQGKGMHPPHFGLYATARFCLLTGNIVDGKDKVRILNTHALKQFEQKFRSRGSRADLPAIELDEQKWDMQPWAVKADCMRIFKEKYLSLEAGSWKHYQEYPSQSEADHALIHMYCTVTKANSLVRHLFIESGLYRPEKGGYDPVTYINRTIQEHRALQAKKAEFEKLHRKFINQK